jgi:hypothetical protein
MLSEVSRFDLGMISMSHVTFFPLFFGLKFNPTNQPKNGSGHRKRARYQNQYTGFRTPIIFIIQVRRRVETRNQSNIGIEYSESSIRLSEIGTVSSFFLPNYCANEKPD